MTRIDKELKYPQNLVLKKAVNQSGYKIGFLAEKLRVSRQLLSDTINGRRKSIRLVKELVSELGL